ncbi:MAG: tetratricopeptide repeat protein, partial [Agathobacter sp.]|nr:tetratricopeptide repeat protein [Agathobacter sp.]
MDYTKYNETVQTWIKTIEQNVSSDAELALKYCEDLIGYAKEIGDENLVAWGYYYKGVTYYLRNDGSPFYQAITDTLSHLSVENDWELTARCYNFLGIFSVSHGNPAIGIDYYLTAINACEVAKLENLKAMISVNLGMLNIIYGRYDEAIEVLEEAREYFSQHPENPRYEEFMVVVHENLAKAYLCKGELIEAKCCFEVVYSEYVDYLSQESSISVSAIEAMYYHVTEKDKKCEDIIAKIHNQISENLPVMDLFEDIHDYCKILLERDKKEEFWKIINIIEPKVKSLDIANMMLKTLSLKIEYYRKHDMQDECLQTAAQYYDYSKRAEEE